MTQDKHHFYEFLTQNNVLCQIPAMGSTELLDRMLKMLKRHHPALDLDLATREIVAREELFPSMIAPGLALPHARLPGLTEPLLALALSPAGVDFGEDAGVAHVVSLLLSPVDEPNLHLQICSALAGEFTDPAAIEAVAELKSQTDVIAYFRRGSTAVIPDYLKAAALAKMPAQRLLETDSLARAIELFATSGSVELVVFDSVGDLRGVLALSDLLKYCLPEHLLWMEDLSPIYLFQPFAEALKNAPDTKVADLMREEFSTVPADAPAIQLAKLFITGKQQQLIITDDGGGFAGVVGVNDFCARLFWE